MDTDRPPPWAELARYMIASHHAYDLIKAYEQFHGMPYRHHACGACIGYRHVVTRGYSVPITHEHAHNLLMVDMHAVERTIYQTVDVQLTQGQFDAIACYVFDVGNTAWSQSRARAVLNLGRYRLAADHMTYGYAIQLYDQHDMKARRQSERHLWNLPDAERPGACRQAAGPL